LEKLSDPLCIIDQIK